MHPVTIVLKNWYAKNKRPFPWRETHDPYIIWLSEIILQQTRTEQGLPYFEKFAAKYPTIKRFASAPEDEILKLWQGLGYYSRARNMHLTAKFIVKAYNGTFPSEFNELKKLKGVGDYTAAAIASFAFNKPHAVVDGNVNRFLSRYFGIKTPVDSTEGRKKINAVAQELLDKKNPGIHNQAMMEFGAVQCKPVNADCEICPLNRGCFAFLKKRVRLFPVKSKKQKIRERFFNYLFIEHKNKTFLNKRTGKDIWKNLYELPLIETDKKISLNDLMKTREWKRIFGASKIHIEGAGTYYKHQLSHQTIYANFYSIVLKSKLSAFVRKEFIETHKNEMDKYGVPRLVEKFLEAPPRPSSR